MHRMNTRKLWIAFSLFVITAFSQTSFAQGLNWEGQTGALLTPFAYTAGSPAGKFGKPEVAFHYLNSGSVIGNDYQFSVTEGVCKHFEVGFTQSFSSMGSVNSNADGLPINVTSTAAYPTYVKPASSLFGGGFSAIHGKVTLVSENAMKTKWVPAIAVGAIGRFGAQRVSYATAPPVGALSQTNGDFYIVATKTVTQVKGLPFVLSLGDKLTDASIMGVAGNAGNATGTGQRWQGRVFGAAAFVVKGPAKSALIFGSEVVQQPHYIQGLNSFVNNTLETSGVKANIPTSESYFVRVVPHLEGSPLQIDLGVAHFGGKIINLPGAAALDINANARVGMGVSYHF